MAYTLNIRNSVAQKIIILGNEANKYPEKRNKEFYTLLIAKETEPDTILDIRVPYQMVDNSMVIANKRSIVEISIALKPDEKIVGSHHLHPFSKYEFLSYTDNNLLGTMLDEMAVNNIRWVEHNDGRLLPELEFHAKNGYITLNGDNYDIDSVSISGVYLAKLPTARVYALVSGIKENMGKFYGQCLVREYSITSGKAEREWKEDIDISVLPPSPDDPEVDEEELKRMVEERFLVQSYKMDKKEYHEYNDGYHGYYVYRTECKDLEDYQNSDSYSPNMGKKLDEIIDYLEEIQTKLNNLDIQMERIYGRKN